MRPLTADELLQVWESGLKRPLLEKSLHLLGIACSPTSLNTMAQLSIGERDARLLQVREWLFGSRLYNTAHCPECATLVEWETDLNALQLPPLLPDVASKIFSIEMDGFHLRFRLLNSNDLLKATSEKVTEPRKMLAQCILDMQHEEQQCDATSLPDSIWEALQQRISEADPQADIQMMVHCPDCSNAWQIPFDIMSYLWIEIDNWAKHMLQEVFVLAKAFSWSETAILNMSAQRRQLYLEMLRS